MVFHVRNIEGQNPSEHTVRLKEAKIRVKDLRTVTGTLKYLINEHARLTILKFSSTLLALIRSCLLNCFTKNFHPACLLHPACLTIPESTCFSLIFS